MPKRLLFFIGFVIMIKLSFVRAIATVAQSVEQLIRNQQVAGSSPASSSKKSSWRKPATFFIVSNVWTDLRVGAVLRVQNALPTQKNCSVILNGKGRR